MTKPLEDIRVGDIMLYGGHEVRLTDHEHHGYRTVVSDAGGTWFLISSDILSNPEFRVGDLVRVRGHSITVRWRGVPNLVTSEYALVERAPVEEKKPEKKPEKRAGPWVRMTGGDWCRDNKDQRVAKVVVHYDGECTATTVGYGDVASLGLSIAKHICDLRLLSLGYVLDGDEPAPVSDTVKQERKADFIIEAWKQWPEHRDDGSCTAAGCGVCAIDKAEDTVPDNKPFVKHDESKPRMDLLPPLALKAMARVLTLGAAKYGDTNWRQIPREERSRLVASLLRHVTAAMAGEDLDPESGESHWAHAASNASFLCELFEIDKIAEEKFRR